MSSFKLLIQELRVIFYGDAITQAEAGLRYEGAIHLRDRQVEATVWHDAAYAIGPHGFRAALFSALSSV